MPTSDTSLTPPSETGRRLARTALDAFGGVPQVAQFLDADETHAVDILTCADRPTPGFSTYSTLTLHRTPVCFDDRDVLDGYQLSETLHHLVWAPPFAWDELGRVDAGDGDGDGGTVHWLQAVPISDGERELLDRNGFDALETLYEENDVEYFDLTRASVV